MSEPNTDWPSEPGTYWVYPHIPDSPKSMYILLDNGRWWHPQCEPGNDSSDEEIRATYARAELWHD